MNQHYRFHVEYFNYLLTDADAEEQEEHCRKNNKELLNFRLPAKEEIPFSEHCFHLKTLYPGLLAGLGYAHEAMENVNNQIKLGFSLDFVTGLPVIPGSSVKGVLRSLFDDEEAVTALRQREYWPKAGGQPVDADALPQALFGESENDGQVIFWDAWPVKSASDKVFGLDYITPHLPKSQDGKDLAEEYRGLTNPVPIMMLKVIPGVTWRFRFSLDDIRLADGTGIAAEAVCKLFRELLLITGIGAKTNTGFGALETDAAADIKWRLAAEGKTKEEIEAPVWLYSLSEERLAQAFGKDKNKTLKQFDLQEADLRKLGKELRGEMIASWAGAEKKSNKRKAYKFFFPSQHDEE
ncbi:MAG TPA: type III-B CRISPR module RAMP protein Cmr6 [Desulfobulbaceae bacterium]|nr:type III-B CRISPR module RAMP protein Cmr6 [Desulfobulbaceae bacterium]